VRYLPAVLLSVFVAGNAGAQEIRSAYSELDSERDCAIFDRQEGEDWTDFVCSGYKGYPVFLYYSDARESAFYGFPPQEGRPAWESFTGFNNAGPKIEWRIEKNGGRELPFATIHRWFVAADPENSDEHKEVLVVHKVGQIGEWEGCVVGYVAVAGNENANEKARQIADERARNFTCGTDEPVIVSGSVPLPDFRRSE